MSQISKTEVVATEQKEAEIKEALFKGVALSWFTAVVAHTLNLQSEAICFRNACKGDLGRSAQLAASSNAAAGILGVIVNQFGGKLSDSLGRRPFYFLGPLVQVLAGLAAFSKPGSPLVLAVAKTLRMVATTFSGTVMGTAGMRDVFQGQEMAVRASKAGSIVGLGIMLGPLLEGLMLKRAGSGREHVTYLALSTIGLMSLATTACLMPETLPPSKRHRLDIGAVAAAANPFGFVRIYTEGNPLLRRVATITSMQTMVDGKNMSDLGQIWMREHLKLSADAIRNFVMGYGFASALAGAKLTPTLLKKMSVSEFTSLTNFLNWLCFTVRGTKESALLYFGALPFMLPGVNGASAAALTPIVNREMAASGFGVGESSAWLNNLRVMASVLATLLYGNCYAFCQRKGLNPGYAYMLAGLVGAAIPQALFIATVNRDELTDSKTK